MKLSLLRGFWEIEQFDATELSNRQQIGRRGEHPLSLLAWALFGARISDVCTWFWAYRSDAIRRLELEASGFEIEADMFTECARNGLRIAEIPITYRARADQPKLSSLRDGVKIGMFLWKRRLGQVSKNVGQTQLEKKPRLY